VCSQILYKTHNTNIYLKKNEVWGQ